jgi:protein-tyrosine phosphatase
VPTPVRVCFVCAGNICRSPTAAGIARQLVEEFGHTDRILVDSAGTGGWHAGQCADDRAAEEARRRGYDIDDHVARQFSSADFDRFDLILVMDWQNRSDLLRLEPTPDQVAKIHYLRDYDPAADDREVPDPYSGGRRQFARVFDMIEAACRNLVARLVLGDLEPAQ